MVFESKEKKESSPLRGECGIGLLPLAVREAADCWLSQKSWQGCLCLRY